MLSKSGIFAGRSSKMNAKYQWIVLMVVVFFVSACAGQAQPPRVEEITFQSGSFTMVGDLRTPGGKGPFPLVLFVHGSGPADRYGTGEYLPIMERMLQAGYATFAWDKPGTGESTGMLDDRRVLAQRTQILLEAIKVMKSRPEIDPKRIGLWGISQAGYVMPRVLAQSKDVAFMICVSCAGMSGYDQMSFQITAMALCRRAPEEKADQKAALLDALDQARTYETYAEYLNYREVLKALAGLVPVPLESRAIVPEKAWQKNDPTAEGLWNPAKVIEQVKIPILAIYGDKDRQIDPLQGAYAYRVALEQAGNPHSRVEVFPNANHAIAISESGCPEADQQWFEQYVKTLGFSSLDEALAAVQKDPYHFDKVSAWPFASGYLDTMVEWLQELK
jgi:uncharacterized protein